MSSRRLFAVCVAVSVALAGCGPVEPSTDAGTGGGGGSTGGGGGATGGGGGSTGGGGGSTGGGGGAMGGGGGSVGGGGGATGGGGGDMDAGTGGGGGATGGGGGATGGGGGDMDAGTGGGGGATGGGGGTTGGGGGSFTPADGGPSRVEWARWVDSQPRDGGEIIDGGTALYSSLPRGLALDSTGALHAVLQGGGANVAYWPTADGGVSINLETSLVRLSPAGDWLGVHRFISGTDNLMAMAVSADGGLYVAGSYATPGPQLQDPAGGANLGLTHPSGFATNSHQGFWARYSTALPPAREWATTFGSIQWDEARDLALNPVAGGTHEYVVTGYFSGSSVTIGRNTTIAMTGNCGGGLECAFIAAFDGTGAAVWANWTELVMAGTSSNSTEAFRVVADDAGNYYLFGRAVAGLSVRFFQNPATPTAARAAGTDPVISSDPGSGFIAKYNNQGVLQWVKSIGQRTTNNPGTVPTDLAVDRATGQLFVVGHIGAAQYRFDPDDATVLFPPGGAANGDRGYIASYDTNGDFLWVKAPGEALGTNAGVTHVKAVTTDRQGHVYVLGWLSGPTRFGDYAVSPTYTSAFIASYDLAGAARWVEASSDKQGGFVGSGFLIGWTDHHLVATDDGSALYAAGSFNGANIRFGAFTGPWRLTNEGAYFLRLRAAVP